VPQANCPNGLWAEFNAVGAIGRAPVGAIGCSTFDECYGYSSQSSEAGTHWQFGIMSISLAMTMVPEL